MSSELSPEDRRMLRACKVGWGNVDEPQSPNDTDFGMAYLEERRYRLRAESQVEFAHQQLQWHERRRAQVSAAFWVALGMFAAGGVMLLRAFV